MVKKKFIDKKSATTYSVVHRSQQDGAFGIEDRPSEHVLLAQKPVNTHAVKRSAASEVTGMGFKNDGYDYERHLRPVGGGTFVGADGKAGTTRPLPAEAAALPAELFATDGAEMERDHEAVTLDPALMDAEVADALFDDAAFDDCEELLDDFVVEAAQPADDEPEAFDYDAHIARLIAAAGEGHLHESDEEEDYFAGRDRGDVDAAFDAALAGYSDSDEESDEGDTSGDDDDDDTGVAEGVARIALDDESVLGAMLDETLRDRAVEKDGGELAFFDGPKRPDGTPLPYGGRAMDMVVGEADAELREMYAAEDVEYEDSRAKWDVESVWDASDCTSNRPNIIDGNPRAKDSKKPVSRAARRAVKLAADQIAEEEYAEAAAARALPPQPPRKKEETPEEKRARKAAVKAAAREGRQIKKENKLAWKDAAARAPNANYKAPSVFSLGHG